MFELGTPVGFLLLPLHLQWERHESGAVLPPWSKVKGNDYLLLHTNEVKYGKDDGRRRKRGIGFL